MAMKLAGLVLTLAISAAAQPAERTASVIVRDPATGEAPKRITATLWHDEGFGGTGMNARFINGVYRIDGIAPGVYRLELGWFPARGDRAYNRTTEKVLTLVAGQELTVEGAIPVGSSFSGRVLDDGGHPVPRASVTVMSKVFAHASLRYAAFSRVETDSLGVYRFEGLEPGRSYIVRADHSVSTSESPADTYYPNVTSPHEGGEIVLRPGELREGIDIRRRRRPSFCVDGTMQGLHSRVAAIEVVAVGVVSDIPMTLPNTAHSDAPDGRYEVCGLGSGRYHLLAGAFPDQATSYVAGTVELKNQDAHGFRLRPMSAVLFNAEAIWQGDPAERQKTVEVSVAMTGWRIGFTRPVNGLRVPGRSAVSVDLWPGEYDVYPVKLLGESKGVYVKSLTWNGQRLKGGILEIAGDTKTCDVRVALSGDGASVAVHVVDNTDRPIANSYVAIFPADVSTAAEMSARAIIGQADQNGLYTVDSLPPGEYSIIVSANIIDSTANRVMKLWDARDRAKHVRAGANSAVEITVVSQNPL